MNEQLLLPKYQPIDSSDYSYDKTQSNKYIMIKDIALTGSINLLIIGHVSSGKTTYLETVIQEYYKNNNVKLIKENCLYINNLKDQGISYYRNEVKTFCQTSSLIANKKKIIVLDDIDLLNEQSQQVFRNLIDKFDKNILFLASCLNVQKVIDSLQSRFFITKLPTITQNVVRDVLDKIINNENIVIDKESCEFIIRMSNNNIKLLFSYLQKFKIYSKPININITNSLCCNINFIELTNYTKSIMQHKIHAALDIIYNIYDNGYSVMDILDSYFMFVKTTHILNEEIKYKIIPVICKYITFFYSIHEDEIELALFSNNLIHLFI